MSSLNENSRLFSFRLDKKCKKRCININSLLSYFLAKQHFVSTNTVARILKQIDIQEIKKQDCNIVKYMDTIFKYVFMERQNYCCLSM